MKTVNIHEAKTTLSELISTVEQGEEVVIARRGVPVVRLVAIEPVVKRVPGLWRALPGWENFVLDSSSLAPMTDEQIAEEGWPV